MYDYWHYFNEPWLFFCWNSSIFKLPNCCCSNHYPQKNSCFRAPLWFFCFFILLRPFLSFENCWYDLVLSLISLRNFIFLHQVWKLMWSALSEHFLDFRQYSGKHFPFCPTFYRWFYIFLTWCVEKVLILTQWTTFWLSPNNLPTNFAILCCGLFFLSESFSIF